MPMYPLKNFPFPGINLTGEKDEIRHQELLRTQKQAHISS
jgi:hypothetical protein